MEAGEQINTGCKGRKPGDCSWVTSPALPAGKLKREGQRGAVAVAALLEMSAEKQTVKCKRQPPEQSSHPLKHTHTPQSFFSPENTAPPPRHYASLRRQHQGIVLYRLKAHLSRPLPFKARGGTPLQNTINRKAHDGRGGGAGAPATRPGFFATRPRLSGDQSPREENTAGSLSKHTIDHPHTSAWSFRKG